MTGAITAGVAAVGSLALGAYSVSQQGSIAGQQMGIAQSQLAMEQQLYNDQGTYRTQLNQLLADPSSVTKLPGYQFNLDQGAETVARQYASNPGGAGAAALTRYGQDYASSAYLQQAQLLASLSGLQQNPAAYGSNANSGAAGAASTQGMTFNEMQQLLAQGGAVAKLFGPGGTFGSAGTPANPGTGQMGPGGMSPGGWFTE